MNPALPVAIVTGMAAIGAGLGWFQGGLTSALVGVSVGALLGILGLFSTTIFRQKSGPGQLVGIGLFVLFIGERLVGIGPVRMALSGLALLIIVAAIGLRLRAMQTSTGRTQAAHRMGLLASVVVLIGLGLYAATFDAVTLSMFPTEAGQNRWVGTLTSLFPILLTVGMLPMLAVDRVIGLHPKVLPPRAARESAIQALSAALAICLVFPVNYLAKQNEWTSDVAYFRTTDAGEATLAIAASLPETVEATLFFPAGSDVGAEVIPYFEKLESVSGGLLKVLPVDQALVPSLAEELKIRDNGWIALKMGDSIEKMKIGTKLKKAKRNLKKLDETVQKNLLKVTRGQRRAYFVVGHGEGNFRERENTLRKLNLFKKALESQNYKASNLGLVEGLGNAVPADADLVILAAPNKPLSEEEVDSLKTYVDGGGAMFVMAEAGDQPMTEFLGHYGVTVGEHLLANAQHHARQTRGANDRVLLTSNRFGSHAATRTLSKNGTTMHVLLPSSIALTKANDATVKLSTLIRSHPETWEDVEPNRRKDPTEVGKVHDLAVAVEPLKDGAETGRMIIVGDVNWASDPVVKTFTGNQVFLLDGIRWLQGDESISGDTSNEEDVLIEHTRSGDVIWFYLTVFAMPMLVFGLGVLSIRLREKNA